MGITSCVRIQARDGNAPYTYTTQQTAGIQEGPLLFVSCNIYIQFDGHGGLRAVWKRCSFKTPQGVRPGEAEKAPQLQRTAAQGTLPFRCQLTCACQTTKHVCLGLRLCCHGSLVEIASLLLPLF